MPTKPAPVAGAPTIALLRGINVGGHRLAMTDLRQLYESLGCTQVRTLLASGNVIFTPPPGAKPGFARELEAAFAGRFGFAAPAAFIGREQLGRVLADNPLPLEGVNPSRFFVALPTGGAHPVLAQLLEAVVARDWGAEALAVGQHAVYCHHPEGIHDSPLAKAVARATRDVLTWRNLATLSKLHAAAASPDA